VDVVTSRELNHEVSAVRSAAHLTRNVASLAPMRLLLVSPRAER
jgi:hypothetical protein